MKNIIIITICVSLFFTNCKAQKNNKTICVNMTSYQKYALEYIDKKYYEISKISNSILNKYKQSLVPCIYEREQISFYPIPIFKLKKEDIDYSEIKNIVDLIDFTNIYENQVVHLYQGNSLISEHIVNFKYQTKENWQEQYDEFNFFTNSLLLHKTEPITGLPYERTNIYAYKEQLEKKYFLFFIEGIDTYFIYKNNNIHAVEMICKETISPDHNTFEDYFECLKPVFVDINEYFRSLNINLIYDDELAKIIAEFKKKYNYTRAEKCNVLIY